MQPKSSDDKGSWYLNKFFHFVIRQERSVVGQDFLLAMPEVLLAHLKDLRKNNLMLVEPFGKCFSRLAHCLFRAVELHVLARSFLEFVVEGLRLVYPYAG